MNKTEWVRRTCQASPVEHLHLDVLDVEGMSFCFLKTFTRNLFRHQLMLFRMLELFDEEEREILLKVKEYGELPETNEDKVVTLDFVAKFVPYVYNTLHKELLRRIVRGLEIYEAIPLDPSDPERGAVLFDRLGRTIWIDSMEMLKNEFTPPEGEESIVPEEDAEAIIEVARGFKIPAEKPAASPDGWTYKPFHLVRKEKIPFVLLRLPTGIVDIAFSRRCALDLIESLELELLCDPECLKFRNKVSREEHIRFVDNLDVKFFELSSEYTGVTQSVDDEIQRSVVISPSGDTVLEVFHRNDSHNPSTAVLEDFTDYLDTLKDPMAPLMTPAVSDIRATPRNNNEEGRSAQTFTVADQADNSGQDRAKYAQEDGQGDGDESEEEIIEGRDGEAPAVTPSPRPKGQFN